MHSSFHLVPRLVAVLLLISSLADTAVSADDTVDRPAARCQKTIATGIHAFVARELSGLGRCVGAAFSCVETAPADAECLPKVRVRCERTIARLLRRETQLARAVATRCDAVGVERLLDPNGLGFARLAPLCPALGTARGDAGVLGTCLARLARCRGERLLAGAFPRGGELLRIADVPWDARRALTCFPDRGGSGSGERDADVGALVMRCARTTARATARFATRTLVNLARCTRTVATCADTTDPADDCSTTAAGACAAAFARIDGARAFFGKAVANACGGDRVDFATLAGPSALNAAALADDCAAVRVDDVDGVGAFAECLVRRHECELADLATEGTPKTEDLLALAGRSVARPYCVAPTPTSTVTPAPAPTPAGPTRTPRPGETATPTVARTPQPQPTATPFCGNDVLDDDEECDGQDLGDETCEDLCFEVGERPVLSCSPGCRLDFSGCDGVDCEAP